MILGLWVAVIFLFLLLLGCGFLLLGILRRVELLTWRVEQLEYRTPRRIGRDGLRPGTVAPDFRLPNVRGSESSLSDFRGKDVLMVFTQEGCGPCHATTLELKHFQNPDRKILIVHSGSQESGEELLEAVGGVNSEVLLQPDSGLSKKYEAFVTPFLFAIDPAGVVISRGIAHTRQQIQFILDGEGQHLSPIPIPLEKKEHHPAEQTTVEVS